MLYYNRLCSTITGGLKPCAFSENPKNPITVGVTLAIAAAAYAAYRFFADRCCCDYECDDCCDCDDDLLDDEDDDSDDVEVEVEDAPAADADKE